MLSMGRVNEFKGNLDPYLKNYNGFNYVMITLSPLEPFALCCMLTTTVLGKLCIITRSTVTMAHLAYAMPAIWQFVAPAHSNCDRF